MMRYVDWLITLAVLLVALMIFSIVVYQAAPAG
jgi:uncharacterized membrane protein